ncbi:MAG: YidH family protein [Myxococcaceae bacterium]
MPETPGKPTVSEEKDRPLLQVLPGPPAYDLRVLQANERTLLAWIRTGLALMAFGFVVARIGLWLHGAQPAAGSGLWSGGIGSAFVVLGTVSNALAALRYVRVRKAIIEGRGILPGNAAVLSLATGLVVLGGILVVYLALR